MTTPGFTNVNLTNYEGSISWSSSTTPLAQFLNNANAQCNSWVGNPRETEAKEAHVLYRQMVKGKTAADLAKLDDVSFGIIYDNWKKAFDIAPMADGQRANHYVDGVEIMKAKKRNQQMMQQNWPQINLSFLFMTKWQFVIQRKSGTL